MFFLFWMLLYLCHLWFSAPLFDPLKLYILFPFPVRGWQAHQTRGDPYLSDLEVLVCHITCFFFLCACIYFKLPNSNQYDYQIRLDQIAPKLHVLCCSISLLLLFLLHPGYLCTHTSSEISFYTKATSAFWKCLNLFYEQRSDCGLILKTFPRRKENIHTFPQVPEDIFFSDMMQEEVFAWQISWL